MLPPSHRRVNLSSHGPLYVTTELAATAAAEGWPVCLYSLIATSSGSVNFSWTYLTRQNEFASKRPLHDLRSFSPSEALVEVGEQLLLLHVLLVHLVYCAKIQPVDQKTCDDTIERSAPHDDAVRDDEKRRLTRNNNDCTTRCSTSLSKLAGSMVAVRRAAGDATLKPMSPTPSTCTEG